MKQLLNKALILLMVLFCYAFDSVALAQTIRANGLQISTEWQEDDPFNDLASFAEPAGNARIVHFKGDSGGEADELFQMARRRLIRFLHEKSGYDVMVLPVGIFEGAWANTQLLNGTKPSEASLTFYRVWRQSPAFLDILSEIQTINKDGGNFEIIGGLCRYHAAGKTLYSPHLIEFFETVDPQLLRPALKDRIQKYLAGRARLSRATAEDRQDALGLSQELLEHFAQSREKLEAHYGARLVELEAQFLRNMVTFVELEMLRAGDKPEDENFPLHEKKQNLDWFLEKRYPEGKIIYWEGRGGGDEALPTDAEVYVITLSYEKV